LLLRSWRQEITRCSSIGRCGFAGDGKVSVVVGYGCVLNRYSVSGRGFDLFCGSGPEKATSAGCVGPLRNRIIVKGYWHTPACAVWIISQAHFDFKTVLGGHSHIFEISAFFFILTLALDLLQTFTSSIVYWFGLNNLDKSFKDDLAGRNNTDFDYTHLARRTPWIFYAAKTIVVLVATRYLLVGIVLLIN
jgi:hypothetical protein